MNLKDILAISGEGTLFKFIAQGKNAVIVENLETGRRLSAGAASKVSALDEIALFTTGEDMPLGKVMDLIWEKENGGETLSHKLPDAELKKYFDTVMPDYDHDRVYTSDIKKVLHWYNILHKLNLLVKEEEKTEEPEAGTDAVVEAGTDAVVEDGNDTKAGSGDVGTTGPDDKESGSQTRAGDKAEPKVKKTAPAKGGKAKPAAGK
ncbi:MAG: DUF5606 domain-containing protein [Bacteroidales bacterium]|nr:DUF5606 domain-containing protein [Bacteroidales bacterium]